MNRSAQTFFIRWWALRFLSRVFLPSVPLRNDHELNTKMFQCVNFLWKPPVCSTCEQFGQVKRPKLLWERHWWFLFNDILAGKTSAIWCIRTFGLPIHTEHSNWTGCRGTPFSVDCPTVHYDCHTLSVLWKCIQSWRCPHICCTCIHILMVINLWTVRWRVSYFFLFFSLFF
jgi:hypothetical protein